MKKHEERSLAIGGLEDVYTFHDLFRAGKQCCNGVRWKSSVQLFELRLLSGTAARRRDLLNGRFTFSKYVTFLLRERGKVRRIDAPRIQDRQVEKLYTQKVLLPLYLPGMIYNNGASLPGKGLAFSQKQLMNDLCEHYRKYGREGGIILTDARKFFPSADHDIIMRRHEKYILNDRLRAIGDAVLDTTDGNTGLPLGVEPSQAEMIAYPSAMDQYLTCQIGLKQYGHYMDDFYAIVPPGSDYRKIMTVMEEQASKCGIRLNRSKTRYIPLHKSFRFCKAKYTLTESGKIVVRACRGTKTRDRRKLLVFSEKLKRGEIGWPDLWASINGMMAYLERYHEHNTVLELRRLFYRLFGFSCENYESFMAREKSFA